MEDKKDSAQTTPPGAPTSATPADSPPPNKARAKLPFSNWWPLAAGVLAGIALRFAFSAKPGGAYATMMGAFIYLAPVVVSAVTVYVAETGKRRTWRYYFWSAFFANVLFVAGTLLILIEGLICAIIILPFFGAVGGLAGLVMGVICRITNWPKQALYGITVLPLVLGFAESYAPLPERIGTVERRLLIDASPAAVWQEIHEARGIQASEVAHAWVYRIGVPLPLAGVTQETPTGRVRKITMGKGIHYDQVFIEWEQERYLRWKYRFDEDSFPPRALDDHVRIGGHYFDLIESSYTLMPKDQGTELTLRMTYRVSTQFNWYADPIARYLIGNVEEVILDFYRKRSQSESEAKASS